jgi:hypothetical protein
MNKRSQNALAAKIHDICHSLEDQAMDEDENTPELEQAIIHICDMLPMYTHLVMEKDDD